MKGQLIQLSMKYKTEEEMACVSPGFHTVVHRVIFHTV